jgi:hypothetical protein
MINSESQIDIRITEKPFAISRNVDYNIFVNFLSYLQTYFGHVPAIWNIFWKLWINFRDLETWPSLLELKHEKCALLNENFKFLDRKLCDNFLKTAPFKNLQNANFGPLRFEHRFR